MEAEVLLQLQQCSRLDSAAGLQDYQLVAAELGLGSAAIEPEFRESQQSYHY